MSNERQGRAFELGSKVVYQIYIRSFQDSDGDGIGDLAGITSRLDYLADLGVDYLWITPFYPSPQRDNGYDVADYRAINPLYGTMADFEELAREARARGIELMLDMVFNHTSTDHEWFRRALAGEEKYLAYYKFVDAAPGATADDPGRPPTNWESKFGGNAWEYVPELGKWYLHLFDVSQADLNWDNPEVRAELADVLRFWRGKGVNSFRFDVVNLISKPEVLEDDFEGDGRRFYSDGPHIHEYLQELVREGGIDGLVTVGEMSSTSLESCVGYTRPERHELSMAFSFHHLKVDYAGGDKWALAEPDIARLREILGTWQEGMAAGGGWNALFWSNHDQPRPNSRFGDTDRYWRESSELLAICTHLMRGTPYIYQGEELGQTISDFESIDQYRDVESFNYYRILQERGLTPDEAFAVVHARSRDDGRTPMAWDDSPNGGFTTGEPWLGLAGNYRQINAAAEMADPASVRVCFQELIRIRKAEPVVQAGDVHFFTDVPEKVIAYERRLDAADELADTVGAAAEAAGTSNESAVDAAAVFRTADEAADASSASVAGAASCGSAASEESAASASGGTAADTASDGSAATLAAADTANGSATNSTDTSGEPFANEGVEPVASVNVRLAAEAAGDKVRRVLVLCNFGSEDVAVEGIEIASGHELLIGNYGVPVVDDGIAKLRPYEAVALCWH